MAEEKNFENKIKRYLISQGIYPFGTPRNKMVAKPIGYFEKRWGGGFSKSGLPDLHIVIKGKSLDVELKATNGKPSPLQLFNLHQINESECMGIIIYPKDFERLKEIIKEMIEQ